MTALASEMDGVSDKIGTSADTADDATVFGRIMLAIDSMNQNASSQADRIISAVKAAINASAAEAAGFGDGSYGELSTGRVIPVSSQSSQVILKTTSCYIPAGETLTVDKPCAGLVIYSQGDIVIDGTIDMTNKGYYSTSPASSITVNGVSVTLARCGNGGASAGGKGGKQGGYAGSGGSTPASAYNHTCGGQGAAQAAGGGCGNTTTSGSAPCTGNSYPAPSVMTDGAGAIILIAYGKIIINGRIISTGKSNTSVRAKSGGNAQAYYDEMGNFYGAGGWGGDGGTGGCGGGAVTLIYGGGLIKNGTITLNGGSGGGTGGSGSNATMEGYTYYGGTGGSGANGSSGDIVERKAM